jgi:hypothetical protein
LKREYNRGGGGGGGGLLTFEPADHRTMDFSFVSMGVPTRHCSLLLAVVGILLIGPGKERKKNVSHWILFHLINIKIARVDARLLFVDNNIGILQEYNLQCSIYLNPLY